MSARIFRHGALAVVPLSVFVVTAACSSKQEVPHAGDFTFDAGAAQDVARDTNPSSSDTNVSIADGAPTDTSLADLGTPDAGPPALCPSTFTSPPTIAVTHPTAPGNELLAAITWDELTMAWTTDDGSGIAIHYGDRSGRDAAFASEHTLPASLGPFAGDKVVLSADSLTMLFVSADHTKIQQVTRAARGAEFEPSTAMVAPFRRLVGPDGEGGSARHVSDLVMSKDGKLLFYTDLDRATGSTILLSPRLSDGSWDAPSAITADRLKIESGYRRRPTGLSADARTLFYFDEVTNTAALAFRASGTTLFSDFFVYSPNGLRAMPADSCDRVYLTVETDADEDAGSDGAPGTVHHIAHAP